MHLINVGVSQCLLGDPVRYDGEAKFSANVAKQLAAKFQLVPVCPEVESGMPVPRPPIELVRYPHEIKVLGRDNSSLDVTQQLTQFCEAKVPTLMSLSGFVVTPRSPSCGVNSVPLRSANGRILKKTSGVFSQALMLNFPNLPIIEEPDLHFKDKCDAFYLRVICYYLVTNELLTLLPTCLINGCLTPRSSMNKGEQVTAHMSFIESWLNEVDTPQVAELLSITEERLVIR